MEAPLTIMPASEGKVALDLGCGPKPRNKFQAEKLFGIDIRDFGENIIAADLVTDNIPFDDSVFDYVTAFDFIEHVPRLIYCPHKRLPFIELMNEIYRFLKPGGTFFSFTPAFPAPAAFQDPTHVNIITDATFPNYFDDKRRWGSMYGFNGYFDVKPQTWNGQHLETTMVKV